MNTNAQTHYELIWSFEFDKTWTIITLAVAAALLVAFILFARKRRHQ
jgi:LPXTG-motif cell wall-anchored protein